MSQDRPLVDVLGNLNTLLQRGNLTYFQYMAEGKTFMYASILRDNNVLVRQLLLDNCHRLPADLQDKALEIINHIDVWNCQWQDMADTRNFRLTDPFVFDGKYKFPADSVSAIMAYQSELIDTP